MVKRKLLPASAGEEAGEARARIGEALYGCVREQPGWCVGPYSLRACACCSSFGLRIWSEEALYGCVREQQGWCVRLTLLVTVCTL